MMKRMIGSTALLLAFTLAFGASAYAQNVHLKPPNQNPSFIDGGLVLSVNASLAGLSGANLLIALNAMANATATCTNPAGATKPPGQNPAPVSVSGVLAVPAGQIKNGNLSFTLSTQGPQTPIPGAPGCPNSSWTEDITDLAFTSATINVFQPNPPGTNMVFTVTCSFSPATTNGNVPDSTVSCQ
jgi:hypothetical protein